MKNLLILILLFCVSTAYAKIDTVYTQQNGLVTMQILETPDKSVVMEEKSFKNTTSYTFTEQEINTLLNDGTIKKPLGLKIKTLFPPRLNHDTDMISLENGVMQQDRQSSKPEISWIYLLICMILPATVILWLSVAVPSDKKRQLILFYFYTVAVVAGATLAVASDISLAIQYTVFIAVSCLVGYGVRQLWLRRKKKLTQA